MLNQSIGKLYYSKNTAFYLFIILFAFGFLSGREHIQMATLLIQKNSLKLIVALFWLLHVFKTNSFLSRTLRLPEFHFLNKTIYLPRKHLLTKILGLNFYLNLPFVAYGLFICITAIRIYDYSGGLIIFAILLIVNLISFFLIHQRFKFFYKPVNKVFSKKKYPLNFQIPNWPTLYFPRYILNQEPVLILSTKIFTMGLLSFAIYLYPTDDYDIRWISIFALFSGAGLFAVGRQYIFFENYYLAFKRNFKKSLFTRFVGILATAIFLIIPEFILLVIQCPDNISIFGILNQIFLLISFQFLWMIIFYHPNAFEKDFFNKFYYFGIIIFILIMFKISMLWISIGIILLSWMIFRRNYYKFELPMFNTYE